jgi:hypothetical protein
MYGALRSPVVFLRILPPVPHRLEDRIRALIARAVASDDPVELDELIWQLRNVLHEHAKKLRQLAADKLVPSTSLESRSGSTKWTS